MVFCLRYYLPRICACARRCGGIFGHIFFTGLGAPLIVFTAVNSLMVWLGIFTGNIHLRVQIGSRKRAFLRARHPRGLQGGFLPGLSNRHDCAWRHDPERHIKRKPENYSLSLTVIYRRSASTNTILCRASLLGDQPQAFTVTH